MLGELYDAAPDLTKRDMFRKCYFGKKGVSKPLRMLDQLRSRPLMSRNCSASGSAL